MPYLLKGDEFLNRYRITGTLTTLSPLHIGTGSHEPIAAGEDTLKSTVIKDHRGKPLIPGSSLRGVMRHWLLDVLRGVGGRWAAETDARGVLVVAAQEVQIQAVKNSFSLLELLFGTQYNAGKVEVWDAACTTDSIQVDDSLLHWDPESLTYVDTSVAIDPSTGTALDKLLYNAEIVPPGVDFELTVVAQNLAPDELGLLLFALQGFNSHIWPIVVGARTGRGYGRLAYARGKMYGLASANLADWVRTSMADLSFDGELAADRDAGYFALPEISGDEQAELIRQVKESMAQTPGGQT